MDNYLIFPAFPIFASKSTKFHPIIQISHFLIKISSFSKFHFPKLGISNVKFGKSIWFLRHFFISRQNTKTFIQLSRLPLILPQFQNQVPSTAIFVPDWTEIIENDEILPARTTYLSTYTLLPPSLHSYVLHHFLCLCFTLCPKIMRALAFSFFH